MVAGWWVDEDLDARKVIGGGQRYNIIIKNLNVRKSASFITGVYS